MSRRLTKDPFVGIIVVSAVMMSLGCLIVREQPAPEPVDDECNGVESIPSVVEEDFVANDDCDVVGETIVVRQGTLNVEAGTTLEFKPDAGIRVESQGALRAVGDDEEPIAFTGVDRQPGAWQGIYFDGSFHPDNTLEQVTVEYSGASVWDDEIAVGPAGVAVRQARVQLRDVTVRSGDGWGLFLLGDSRIFVGGTNQITGHTEQPVRTAANLVGALTAETSYRNNDSDYIRVEGGEITEDAFWPPFDVPLLVDGPVVVRANLRIGAGNELVFREGAGMEIAEGGSIDTTGDGERDVTVRGDEDEQMLE